MTATCSGRDMDTVHVTVTEATVHCSVSVLVIGYYALTTHKTKITR